MRVASLPVLFALVAPLFAASPESSSVVVVDSTPSTFTPHYAPENMPKVAASPRGAGSARLSMQGDKHNDDYLSILREIRVKREGPRRLQAKWHQMIEDFSFVDGVVTPKPHPITKYRSGRPTREQAVSEEKHRLALRRSQRDGDGSWTSGRYLPRFDEAEGDLMA